MADEPPKLPPKQEVALALLQTASSVFVHLDPRPEEVLVPAWFKKQPQLVLQIGLNMAVSIPDLDIGEESVSCTLSFNRNPEFCRIPYSAIYGLVGEDGRGMIWPESVPAEVAAAADGRSPVAPAVKERRPKLRVADGSEPVDQPSDTESASDEGKEATNEEQPVDQAAQGTKPEKEPESAAVREQRSESKSKRELPPYLRVVK